MRTVQCNHVGLTKEAQHRRTLYTGLLHRRHNRTSHASLSSVIGARFVMLGFLRQPNRRVLAGNADRATPFLVVVRLHRHSCVQSDP